MQISRRRFLALSATLTLVACSDDDESASSGEPASTEPGSPSTPPREASSTVAATEPAPTEPEEDVATIELDSDPFVYGVASGDPDESSVVLWTRLGGDLPDAEIPLTWEFVADDGTKESGTAMVDATTGHSVHIIAAASGPGSYTFSAGAWTSPEGRTAPIDPTTTELRIAAASCQHYETGFYAAHRDIAEWSPDMVLFLGDFIYEGDPIVVVGVDDDNADALEEADAEQVDTETVDTVETVEVDDGSRIIVRNHENPEPVDLDGYRARYATYLRDQHLQASRAAAPWVAIWDDHEVENDYAGDLSEDDVDTAVFAERRTAAYRAWWEHTPTRLAPPDPDTPYVIHRGLDVGDLVRISLLDGRQFRDDQVSNVILDPGPPAPGWDDPERTMLGDDQEAWIAERFTSSTATWNCLAQQTVLSDTRLGEVGAILNYDQWDGYVPARERLLANAPSNLVTLTGDIHLAGIGEIGPIGDPVGIEFVTTSISSLANVPPELVDVVTSIPSIVDAELLLRGYTRHVVTSDTWTAEFRQVSDVADPDSEVTTWKSFRVDAGTPAATEV